MRREVPIAITMITAILYIFGTVFDTPFFQKIGTNLNSWFTVVKALMSFLGVISLTRVNWAKVSQKRQGLFYSAVILISMFGYMFLGLIQGQDGATFTLLYNNFFSAILMSIFSSLTFWIGSAAYRSFRARSIEATILLVSAAFLMLGSTTIGPAISPVMPKISNWILSVPNTAGMRAVGMGSAIGGIVLALRIMLGLERNYLGSD